MPYSLEVFSSMMQNHWPRMPSVREARIIACAMLCIAVAPLSALRAQTDFFNTDAGRPFRTQNASVIEFLAFEAHIPTAQWTNLNGAGRWRFDQELAMGIFPRTQMDVAASFSTTPPAVPGGRSTGESGLQSVGMRVVHQLNVETLRVPSFALGLGVESGVGSGSGGAHWQTLVAATRTVQALRVHANARMALGNASEQGQDEGVGRWEFGLAADHALVLRHLLIGAEVVAWRPEATGADLAWETGVGVRWQWSVRTSLDAAVARRYVSQSGWRLTAGVSTAFGIRSLFGGLL